MANPQDESGPSGKSANKGAVMGFLMAFVAIAFANNGLGDNSTGVLWQPVTWYLKTALGWNAEDVANYMTALAVPWMLMPIYPMFALFLPIFGRRFKPYLTVASLIGIAGSIMLACVYTPGMILVGLLLTSLGAAMITALGGAVLVQNGKKYEMSKALVNSEWIWYWGATLVASVVGGSLANYLTPAGSFHVAALVYGLAPLSMLVGAWLLLPAEEPAKIDVSGLKDNCRALMATFKVRVLWLMGLFLFFFNFCPSIGTAMSQYHLPDHLHFDQQFIGILSGLASIGSVAGGVLYIWLHKWIRTVPLLYLTIFCSVIALCANCWMVGPVSAGLLFFVNGLVNTIALVEAMALAADNCPDQAEGFAYSILISVIYAAWQLSDNVGSYLYVNVLNQSMNPLFLISAALTAVCAVFLPFLNLRKKE